MNRMEAIAWTLSVCAGLRLSQAKTLSELVASTLHVGRVSLAEIGRRLHGDVAAKHRIKRVWRFTANPRVEISFGSGNCSTGRVSFFGISMSFRLSVVSCQSPACLPAEP